VNPRPIFAVGFLALALAAAACGGSAQSKPPEVLVGSVPTRSAAAPSPSAGSSETVQSPEPTPPPRPPMVVSLAWLDNTSPVPELPFPSAAPSPDSGLHAAIESALAGREGVYSVVVHNFANGRYAELNADQVYYAASLYKLEVLIEAYRQRDAGELDFARLLTLEKKYIELDLKTLELLDILENDQVTVHDAVRAMTIVSDTPTASLLQDTLNPVRVDQTLASLGLTATENANRDLPTTARDMARLLSAIAAGQGGVGEASRVEMLSLLRQEGFRSGIIAGLPPDTAAAHKTGSYTDATHDVALVWGPADPYVIAVLTNRSYDWEPIREVSRAVWDYFAANP
jgi:beta-lactamase class A